MYAIKSGETLPRQVMFQTHAASRSETSSQEPISEAGVQHVVRMKDQRGLSMQVCLGMFLLLSTPAFCLVLYVTMQSCRQPTYQPHLASA